MSRRRKADAPGTVTYDFSKLCGFTAKQLTATQVADRHRYTLFGGSRGPGKSYWLRWYMLRLLFIYFQHRKRENVRVMLGCEDYPTLYERQIVKIIAEFPSDVGTYWPSKTEFRLAPRFGSGVLALRNLLEPDRYQSAEFAAIGIDELTKNPETTFNTLRGSLRWAGIPDTRFVAATNPEANWVRRYWIERDFPEALRPDADQFAFVPALPDDNPHLDPSYWRMLETLPSEAMRQAWRYGDWYAAAEGRVYGEFNAANLTEDEPDPDLPIEVAIDDGYFPDPRATLFIQKRADGSVLVFAELYERQVLEESTIEHIKDYVEALNATLYQTSLIDLVDAVVKPEGESVLDVLDVAPGFYRMPQMAIVSHEAIQLRHRLTAAGIPARNWMGVKRPAGTSSMRLAAINLTRRMICDGKGVRRIFVHTRCRNLRDEITAGYKYPDGENSPSAMPADGNDHACNALESWVWYRLGGAAMSAESMVDFPET